jgi:hypothetical protein
VGADLRPVQKPARLRRDVPQDPLAHRAARARAAVPRPSPALAVVLHERLRALAAEVEAGVAVHDPEPVGRVAARRVPAQVARAEGAAVWPRCGRGRRRLRRGGEELRPDLDAGVG